MEKPFPRRSGLLFAVPCVVVALSVLLAPAVASCEEPAADTASASPPADTAADPPAKSSTSGAREKPPTLPPIGTPDKPSIELHQPGSALPLGPEPEKQLPPSPPAAEPEPDVTFPQPRSVPPQARPAVPLSLPPSASPLRALASEAMVYGSDTVALVKAPFHWDGRQWGKAAATGLVIGGLFLADRSVAESSQSIRTDLSDGVANVTKRFGLELAYGIPAGMLAGGAVFRNPEMRETGRTALEAVVISGIVTNFVLKPLFGRRRPEDAHGDTVFEPGTPDASFPSGHATQAFAAASVISMRSKGWVVPTVAYSLATFVALDRINDNKHYLSDVVAGAVVGTVIGRFIGHRHAPEPVENKLTFNVVPIGGGLAARLTF